MIWTRGETYFGFVRMFFFLQRIREGQFLYIHREKYRVKK